MPDWATRTRDPEPSRGRLEQTLEEDKTEPWEDKENHSKTEEIAKKSPEKEDQVTNQDYV